jgi:hypothetical protein
VGQVDLARRFRLSPADRRRTVAATKKQTKKRRMVRISDPMKSAECSRTRAELAASKKPAEQTRRAVLGGGGGSSVLILQSALDGDPVGTVRRGLAAVRRGF